MKGLFVSFLLASMFSAILPMATRMAPPMSDLPTETKEVILEYVAEKMEEAYPNLIEEIETRANLFNLSAYLNTNRPANGTALTFVPLITLLSGLLG